jgi:hypothetical protein
MSFINFYVLIANVFRHINKKIIEDFTYFFSLWSLSLPTKDAPTRKM